MEWQTMPDTGTRVAVRDDGIPLIVVIPTVEVEIEEERFWHSEISIEDVQMEIEGRLGWRMQTRTIAGVQDPRGWTLVVEAAGRLAVPSTYAEYRESPTEWQRCEPDLRFSELTGVNGRSGLGCLTAPWKGHPRGTWVVYSSGGEGYPAAIGFVREVGKDSVMMALIAEVTDGEA